MKSFKTASKIHSLETILSDTQKYAQQVQKTDKQYVKHPTTFLNNDSFIDGFEEGALQLKSLKATLTTFFKIQ
ncbi:MULTISPECIES: hypothetical protein [Peribacillus]|uniref:hypothetical protein n=1 Tax=Peribacillus TaxID=2675229 RepID=UPI002731BEE4|nr:MULTISPECIES: hypothetical protein [Peribacillus]